VVIPQDVRALLGINPGDTLMVITKNEKAIGMIKTDDMAEFMAYMQNEIQQ
jgi:AbrB family looped-hinge helix DNA binding protein